MAGGESEKANGDSTTTANGSLGGATTMPPSISGSNNGHQDSSSSRRNDIKREEEKEKIFFERIRDGFTYLRDLRDAGHNKTAILAAPPPPSVLPSFLNSVNVNFIDPTTSSITTTMSITMSGSSKPTAPQRLYEKFSTIFQREFQSSIHHVPYQLIRNNSHGVIESLPLSTTVARSHGGGVLLMPSSSSDNNDDAARSAINDYSWERPYCHVYLAACESLEHYRTKVKPSIQAFVSQLEASGKQTTGPARQSSFNENASSLSSSPTKTLKQQQQRQQQRHTPQARYVVIYVPTGDRSSSSSVTTTGDGNTFGTPTAGSSDAAAVGKSGLPFSRLASAARQRIAATAAARSTTTTTNSYTQQESNSNHGSSSAHGSMIDDTEASAEQQLPPDAATTTPTTGGGGSKLGKMEREIAKRFAQDFPNGNVCTLSSLADSDETATTKKAVGVGGAQSDLSAWEKLEWNSVMKALGAAIAGGFADRCHRFDDELRKLDLMRRGETVKPTFVVGSPSPSSGNNSSSNGESKGDAFHLVNFFLVKESFAFTFEQMRLPAEALLQYEELRAFLPEVDIIMDPTNDDDNDDDQREDYQEFSKMALCANILEFRRVLRTQGQLDHVSAMVEEYVFARELSLLFQMHKSIRIAQRFLAFYKQRFDDLSQAMMNAGTDKSKTKTKKIMLQQQMFRYFWEFRCAGEVYLAAAKNGKTPFNTAFARSLCDVLEFAKKRLVWLGAEHYPETRLAFSAQLDPSSIASWGIWQQPNVVTVTEQGEESVKDEDFLSSALASPTSLRLHFLHITSAIVRYNELCGRKRIGALIRTERMELLAEMGLKHKAAEEIRSILRLYGQERWNVCHFSLVLRLISLQRNVCPASEYLHTLVHSFSESLCSVAPTAAVLAIHGELEAILNNATGLQGLSFASAPLFRPFFGLDGKFSSTREGQDRALLKSLCTVGDKVNLSLRITSHLPKDCELDSVEIHLVRFQVYVAAMEDNVTVEDKDVYAKIKTSTTTTLTSGENDVEIGWSPSSSGQFIVAACTLFWRGVAFQYAAKSLRKPTLRIDVVDRKPTQSIKSIPAKLISGRDQSIDLLFCAGSETIEHGTVQLIGSPGLQVNHADSGEAGWLQSLEIKLQPCAPESITRIPVLVNVIKTNSSETSVPLLLVKISTKYRIADANLADDSEGTADHELELKIPVTGKSIFSVVERSLVNYGADRFMLAATLRCNAESAVTTKQFQLQLPSNFIQSSESLDMNDFLLNERVLPGQDIQISFDCRCLRATKEFPGASLSAHFENEHGKALVENLVLAFKEPAYFEDRSDSSYPALYSVRPSCAKVSLGEDVMLLYNLDLPETRTYEKYSYAIDFNHDDWIVRGQLAAECWSDDTETTINVRTYAVPVRPGTLSDFPILTLFGISQQVRTPVLTKLSRVSGCSVMVVAQPEHFAVAFPAVTPAKRTRVHI